MLKVYRVDAQPFPSETAANVAGTEFASKHTGATFSVREYSNEGFFVVVKLPPDIGSMSQCWLSNE